MITQISLSYYLTSVWKNKWPWKTKQHKEQKFFESICKHSLNSKDNKKNCQISACWTCLCIYLFGILCHFQQSTGHITMGNWEGRGNQYIQLVKVLYCKLPTIGKKPPAFPLGFRPGTKPRSQKWEVRVLPLCHRGLWLAFVGWNHFTFIWNWEGRKYFTVLCLLEAVEIDLITEPTALITDSYRSKVEGDMNTHHYQFWNLR